MQMFCKILCGNVKPLQGAIYNQQSKVLSLSSYMSIRWYSNDEAWCFKISLPDGVLEAAHADLCDFYEL